MRKYLRFSFLVYSFLLHTLPGIGEEIHNPINEHALGIAAGGTSGLGIAYRAFFNIGIGYQFTLGAFGTSRYFDIFGGAQMFLRFYEPSPNFRFYGLMGSCFILETFPKHFTIIPGLGVGLEYRIFKGLVAAFDLSLAPFVPIGRPKNPILGYIPLPIPGISIAYYF